MNISEQAKQRKYRKVKTPINHEAGTPICLQCKSRIISDECLQSMKSDGFYFHLECGVHIGVEVIH